ncbi:hypothetical protein PsaNZ64_00330 [Pseudomonas syringae pv. actinidiae]|uniref:hypothetical protein n=1 Tax=Pseudomonas syringae group TaxID=136849 RepID=UPI0006B9CE8B|nr:MULTISPECIES: hypothetical protein [Pseudomonas syringae group]OKS78762.1 hypothetical protein PsaNZ64_00330 [Pseudomonas syringae pv. actinidiae]
MTFITSTTPMHAKGNGYSHPLVIRIEVNREPDNSVLLSSRGGHTGTLIKNAKCVSVPGAEWDSLQLDHADDLALAQWAFSKAGWVLRDHE